jgi:hypothetical protein
LFEMRVTTHNTARDFVCCCTIPSVLDDDGLETVPTCQSVRITLDQIKTMLMHGAVDSKRILQDEYMLLLGNVPNADTIAERWTGQETRLYADIWVLTVDELDS